MMPVRQYGMSKAERGFSLVETMVALVIGLFVVIVVYAVFNKNRESGVLSEDMAKIEEGGRVAMDIIANDIRMAAFAGCGKMPIDPAAPQLFKVGPLTGVDYATYRQGVWVRPYNDAAAKPFVDSGALVGKDGTDVLRVFGITGDAARLTGIVDMRASGAGLTMLLEPDHTLGAVTQGDIFLASSCSDEIRAKGDLFSAAGDRDPAGNAGIYNTDSTSTGYEIGAMVYRYVNANYFIRQAKSLTSDDARTDKQGNPVMSLFRFDSNNNEAIELVESVEAFRVCVGVDRDNNGAVDQYHLSDDTTVDWKRVISARVDLLISSVATDILPQDTLQEFSLCLDDDPSVSVTDRKVRKLFSTTVALRNKIKEEVL